VRWDFLDRPVWERDESSVIAERRLDIKGLMPAASAHEGARE